MTKKVKIALISLGAIGVFSGIYFLTTKEKPLVLGDNKETVTTSPTPLLDYWKKIFGYQKGPLDV